jgi:uncharacterized protein (DUF58 family)
MAVQSNSRFLDLRALASLQHLRFSTKRRIDGTYSGRHLSRQLGGAAEFVDFREYSPGDDLRRLDWKVLARTGRPYLRMYQDETNLGCAMLIDASGSMQFGGYERNAQGRGSKLEYAQYFATAMSHLICNAQDQVALAIAADKTTAVYWSRQYIGPLTSSPYADRTTNDLARHQTGGFTASTI